MSDPFFQDFSGSFRRVFKDKGTVGISRRWIRLYRIFDDVLLKCCSLVMKYHKDFFPLKILQDPLKPFLPLREFFYPKRHNDCLKWEIDVSCFEVVRARRRSLRFLGSLRSSGSLGTFSRGESLPWCKISFVIGAFSWIGVIHHRYLSSFR